MRVEINRGVGERSEVIFSGDDKWMDLNKIYEEFAKSDGYRLEIYRNWNISAKTVKRKFKKEYMIDMTKDVLNVIC